jgi:hypothetical protein
LQEYEPEPVRKAAVIRDYIEKYALIEAKATTPELLNVYFIALEHFVIKALKDRVTRLQEELNEARQSPVARQ